MRSLRRGIKPASGNAKRAGSIFWSKGGKLDAASSKESSELTMVPSLTDVSTSSESSITCSQNLLNEESIRSMVQWIDPVSSAAETHLVVDSIPEEQKKKSPSIWVSKSAIITGINILAALALRQPVLLYGVLLIILRLVLCFTEPWYQFYKSDPEVRGFVKLIRCAYQRALKETDLAVKGSYSRQVVASYAFYACTAPGESVIGSILRYKMSMINLSVVESLQEWQDHRLGYEQQCTRTFA